MLAVYYIQFLSQLCYTYPSDLSVDEIL